VKVYFRGDSLEYKDGTPVLVSYNQLVKACLANDFNSISTMEIICEACQALGYQLVNSRCRESGLFNQLVSDIESDERYQTRKAELLAEQAEKKKAIRKEKQNVVYGEDPAYTALKRRKMDARIRGRKFW